MVYLLILLAMFLVIGPVLWLRPTARERQLARFREKALLKGIKIQPLNLRKDPFYHWVLERNPHLLEHSLTWTRYQKIANEDETGPSETETWVQRKTREGQLVWESASVRIRNPEQVDALLERWSADQDVGMLALELGPRSAAIVWDERGDESRLQKVLDQLQTFFTTVSADAES